MRVLLVPLAGQDLDQPALAAAYAIAAPFRAHIKGLFARRSPVEAVESTGEAVTPELISSVTRAMTAIWDERSKRARAAFDAARTEADAALADAPTGTDTVTARWLEVTGHIEEEVVEYGRLADLIVFAGLHSDKGAEWEEAFRAALFETARPVLLVPEDGAQTIGRSVVVAWNGSAEATRALIGAMPLLQNAEQLHVLTVHAAHVEEDQGKQLGEYLAWHGLMSEQHVLYPDGDTGAALLDKAKEVGADLLVMGGYGHSRMRELIFGGATRYVLAHYDLPVLIAH